MNVKVALATSVVVFAIFFLFTGGEIVAQEPEAETIKNFPQDISSTGELKIDRGQPVYTVSREFRWDPYYQGEIYGKRFDSTGDTSIINEKIVFKAEEGERELLVVDGRVKVNTSETIRQYDLLNGSPVYVSGAYEKNKTLYYQERAIRNFSGVEQLKVIDRKIAVVASEDLGNILWYNGTTIDRDLAYSDVETYQSKPLYRVENGSNYTLALSGEKLDMDGSVEKFSVIGGEIAVSYESSRKVLGEKDISDCYSIRKIIQINGKVACTDDSYSKIYYGDKTIGSSFDSVRKPINYNSSLAYIAIEEGNSFIVSDGEALTQKYSVITDATFSDGSLYYEAVDQGSPGAYIDGRNIRNSTLGLRNKENPYFEVISSKEELYKGQNKLRTAKWIAEVKVSQEGLMYEYFRDDETVLVTPEKTISRYNTAIDYDFGQKGAAYIFRDNLSYHLFYDDEKSMSFVDTAQLNFVNETPYYIAERNGHDLLMDGHNVHTNLTEESKPDFLEKQDEEDNYESEYRNEKYYIQAGEQEYGPFNNPDEIRYRKGNLVLVNKNEEGQEYLQVNSKSYGAFEQIDSYVIGEEKIYFFGEESDGEIKLKEITL